MIQVCIVRKAFAYLFQANIFSILSDEKNKLCNSLDACLVTVIIFRGIFVNNKTFMYQGWSVLTQ